MHAYANSATRRLEKIAHDEGVEVKITVIEAQEDGRYFVTGMDEEPLKQPVALGFTDEQAIHCLKSHRWERYAMRATPNRLASAPPLKKGKRVRLL